jgi:hypothetical protein
MSDELGVLLVCLFFLDFIYVCATLGYRAVYSTYSLIFCCASYFTASRGHISLYSNFIVHPLYIARFILRNFYLDVNAANMCHR